MDRLGWGIRRSGKSIPGSSMHAAPVRPDKPLFQPPAYDVIVQGWEERFRLPGRRAGAGPGGIFHWDIGGGSYRRKSSPPSRAERSGEGQMVDVSCWTARWPFWKTPFPVFCHGGGSRTDWNPPSCSDSFQPTRRGWIPGRGSRTRPSWTQFCKVIQREDLPSDPRF